MVEVKEMPYSEKYAYVIDSIEYEDTFVPPFIQKHLGDQALVEFQRISQEGLKSIPEDLSFEDKYEIAYSNWISIGKSIFGFIRQQLGEDGIELFKSVDVEALKRKNASPALFLLKLIRALSAGSAFKMVAKKMAYQLQWLSPYSVSELSKRKLVLDMPKCKLLDFPDSDDLCYIG